MVIGHDWGGLVAWTMAAYYPKWCAGWRRLHGPSAADAVRGARRPVAARGAATATRSASSCRCFPSDGWSGRRPAGRADAAAWSGPGWPDPETEGRYRAAMGIPSVAHSALEYHRWFLRSWFRPDGDPLHPADARADPGAHAAPARGAGPVRAARRARGSGRARGRPVPLAAAGRAGHFPHEEQPDRFDLSCAPGWQIPNLSDERSAAGQRDRDAAGRARNARPRDGLGRPLPRGAAGRAGHRDESLAPAQALAPPSTCSTMAGRSTRTRCSRRRGSSTAAPSGTCGGGWPRSRWD